MATNTKETAAAELDRLARRAQAGETRAFERFTSALLPRIQRWARALVGSADDADDLAQEVLVKVHRSLPEFSFGARVTTWVYALTRRTAIDWHRKRDRRERLAESRLETARATEPPALATDLQRLTALVHEEFQRLPRRQREVFDLADLQGMAHEEIAELLQLNAVTVRVHLFRARTTIRTRILQTAPAL
ncbi:MAG TPA: RNA polymerase sigma factor, partial [Longimicrobiales bacterium]|nr:RNA polymerase sigma factor [Longimicrobiales bacterium]